MASWWEALGNPTLTPELRERRAAIPPRLQRQQIDQEEVAPSFQLADAAPGRFVGNAFGEPSPPLGPRRGRTRLIFAAATSNGASPRPASRTLGDLADEMAAATPDVSVPRKSDNGFSRLPLRPVKRRSRP